MEVRGVKIIGFGKAVPGYDGVPGRIVTNKKLAEELLARGKDLAVKEKIPNEELEKFLIPFTTSDEWIQERTGIEKRSFAPQELSTSDLAKIAVEKALTSCNLKKKIQRIDFATVTPDYHMSPPTVVILSYLLGLNCLENEESLGKLFGSDNSIACSSFIAALHNSYGAIASGMCDNAIVVGADIMSRTTNPNDRSFYPVLGDGAGALVLEACDLSDATFQVDSRSNSFSSGMAGNFSDRIMAKMGGSRFPLTLEGVKKYEDRLLMEGRKVFREITPLLFNAKNPQKSIIGNALIEADRELDEIGCIFFHQANLRMITPVEKELRKAGYSGLVFNNIQKYGNTTSASIPLLMAEAHEEGILKYQDIFMSVVFGGGYSWGSAIGYWRIKK